MSSLSLLSSSLRIRRLRRLSLEVLVVLTLVLASDKTSSKTYRSFESLNFRLTQFTVSAACVGGPARFLRHLSTHFRHRTLGSAGRLPVSAADAKIDRTIDIVPRFIAARRVAPRFSSTECFIRCQRSGTFSRVCVDAPRGKLQRGKGAPRCAPRCRRSDFIETDRCCGWQIPFSPASVRADAPRVVWCSLLASHART